MEKEGEEPLFFFFFFFNKTPDPNDLVSAPANQGYSSFQYAVSPRYVEVMGLPLRRGRTLEASDREGTPPVALISESLARRGALRSGGGECRVSGGGVAAL